ncbi:ribbon-helix-helix domain-containing protein [Sphingomonas sp.]|uniref:ribbon-helix-helix domain-containing protein n=1 Tax=Sphingomonas sp. TaxID=28214 RepID=UPI00344E670C|nr:ribbon-helix-helix domain-containing protein [Sphingomonas sp.]
MAASGGEAGLGQDTRVRSPKTAQRTKKAETESYSGQSTLVLRNIFVGGRRTSARLEPALWDALRDIAERQNRSMSELLTEIERERCTSGLTAAIRVYAVEFYRALADERKSSLLKIW